MTSFLNRPQFLILASDGLWDTFTNEAAIAFVREHIHEADFGARSISLESYRRGSMDNIATIVVVFEKGAFAEKSKESAIAELAEIVLKHKL